MRYALPAVVAISLFAFGCDSKRASAEEPKDDSMARAHFFAMRSQVEKTYQQKVGDMFESNGGLNSDTSRGPTAEMRDAYRAAVALIRPSVEELAPTALFASIDDWAIVAVLADGTYVVEGTYTLPGEQGQKAIIAWTSRLGRDLDQWKLLSSNPAQERLK